MSFWAYMLHCRGGAFYVGHTDDLERRVGEHQSGLIPGFSADHLPVELVWFDSFQTRDDAKAVERKLKGWSRAKKMALIRGDWERISMLAKGKSGPSTSSGKSGVGEEKSRKTITYSPKTDHPEPVEGLSFSLHPHPDTPPICVKAVSVECRMTDPDDILLTFKVEGAELLKLPEWSTPVRKDDLWNATCFEMFLKLPDSPGYFEFNLSPSTEWATYSFDGYRDGMGVHEVGIPPHIEFRQGLNAFELEADIDLSSIPVGELIIALSAVIEETDGTKSYWALAHPPGPPDFHHPTCFTLILPAPEPL